MHEVQIRKEDKADTPHIDSQGCPLGTHLLYSISVPPTFPSKRLLHATKLTTVCSALKVVAPSNRRPRDTPQILLGTAILSWSYQAAPTDVNCQTLLKGVEDMTVRYPRPA